MGSLALKETLTVVAAED
jgi:DNA-binding PadR family transcriptional regulator